jgi:hypothetical protein
MSRRTLRCADEAPSPSSKVVSPISTVLKPANKPNGVQRVLIRPKYLTSACSVFAPSLLSGSDRHFAMLA